MRYRFAFVAVLGLGCGVSLPFPRPSGPEPLAGVWEGVITSGSATHSLRLSLQPDSTGYRGSVDLPDQYGQGYDVKNLRIDDGAIFFEFPDVLPPASFSGTLDGGRIHGTFTTQSAAGPSTGTFELTRWSGEAIPYRTQDVSFASGDVPLRGTLFIPNSPGPHPAVVLLHGSGPQTRESHIYYFADQFARNGIAALIYDKRNTGRTDIPATQQGGGTLSDFANDATAAVRYLRAFPAIVDPRRIGLWGSSQGAWIAPMAAERIDGVAFLVLVSGGGVSPARHALHEEEVRLRARGLTGTEFQRAMSLVRLAHTYVRSQSNAAWNRFERELDRSRGEPWFAAIDSFPIKLPRVSPAWKDPDLDYDPVPLLERLRLPVLVVLGAEDDVTPITARVTAAALRKAGNTDYLIRQIPGADHGLWVTPADDDSWLSQRPATGWVEEMIAWVTARARQR
ncbi:MAG TPA: alpha/beta fold hydrolase [Gemmatimonadaceae bacterium]|nr:alpha/beta fold hydrolase [Gemmatimonadaceae bacterium]